jgi:hypothetical protein
LYYTNDRYIYRRIMKFKIGKYRIEIGFFKITIKL